MWCETLGATRTEVHKAAGLIVCPLCGFWVTFEQLYILCGLSTGSYTTCDPDTVASSHS